MRINVYSQELTDEIVRVEKVSNTGRPYVAAQLILHSSPMLHHPPEDDDRSAVTFWLPSSPARRESMAQAFERIAGIFRGAEQAQSLERCTDDRRPEPVEQVDLETLSSETGVPVEMLRTLAGISDPANEHRFTARAALEGGVSRTPDKGQP